MTILLMLQSEVFNWKLMIKAFSYLLPTHSDHWVTSDGCEHFAVQEQKHSSKSVGNNRWFWWRKVEHDGAWLMTEHSNISTIFWAHLFWLHCVVLIISWSFGVYYLKWARRSRIGETKSCIRVYCCVSVGQKHCDILGCFFGMMMFFC